MAGTDTTEQQADSTTSPALDGAGDDTATLLGDITTTEQGQETQSDSGSEQDRPITLADLRDEAQRIADRQVTALMKEVRGTHNGRRRTTNNADSDQQTDSNKDREQAAEDRYNTREARMAFREYLGDSHRFLDGTERELANQLGTSLLSTELAEHGDPDRAGRSAAQSVASQLSAFRKAVEQSTVTRLRNRGALVTEPARGGDSPAGGMGPTPSTTGDLRVSARSLAEEFNREQGYPAAG
ncbi:hypothetical protein [Saccharopolyspora tripterygii]